MCHATLQGFPQSDPLVGAIPWNTNTSFCSKKLAVVKFNNFNVASPEKYIDLGFVTVSINEYPAFS